MKKTKRKWDMLSDAKREYCINETIRFFSESRDEQIGVISAEEVLDFVLEMVAVELYKKGINDAKKIVEERVEDLKVDLDMLVS